MTGYTAGAVAPGGVAAPAPDADQARPGASAPSSQTVPPSPGTEPAGAAVESAPQAVGEVPASGGFGQDSRTPGSDRQEREGREASERLQQAKTRIQALQLRARTAAASGDTQEADRAAREAATVAREISQLAQQLAKSRGGSVAGGSEGASGNDPAAPAHRKNRDGGPDARTVAQGLLADSAPKAAVTADSTDGFLAEARTLASQARSLMDLLDSVPDATDGAGGAAEDTGETDETGQRQFTPSRTGRWADLVAAEQALDEASGVPTQPRRHAPEPGSLVKLDV